MFNVLNVATHCLLFLLYYDLIDIKKEYRKNCGKNCDSLMFDSGVESSVCLLLQIIRPPASCVSLLFDLELHPAVEFFVSRRLFLHDGLAAAVARGPNAVGSHAAKVNEVGPYGVGPRLRQLAV